MSVFGSELLLLFGDELAELPKGKHGLAVGGSMVHYDAMAATLVAVGIAHLVSLGSGFVEAAPQHGRHVDLQLRIQGDGPGFSGVIARANQPAQPVTSVARTILGKRTSSPDVKLVDMARGYLAPTGALTEAPTGGFTRFFAGRKWDVDHARLSDLRPEWDDLRSRWEWWKASAPTLVEPLLDGCRRSVALAKPADNNMIN